MTGMAENRHFLEVVARPEGVPLCPVFSGLDKSRDPLPGTGNCGVPRHLASRMTAPELLAEIERLNPTPPRVSGTE